MTKKTDSGLHGNVDKYSFIFHFIIGGTFTTKHLALAHDQEEPKRPSRARPQDKVALIEDDTKKSTRQKTTKTTRMSIVEPLRENSSAIGDLQARISERANEVAHHRGGHNGQNLHDWLTAAREVLSEES